LTEDSIHGSSTIIKSASANILLSRDKYAEDEVERNTTKIVLSKNRLVGLTGPAGELYYENYTHTLHNKEEYFSKTPRPVSDVPKEKIDF
jgi:twinkle protein